MAARAIGSGTMSHGVLSIPFRVYSAQLRVDRASVRAISGDLDLQEFIQAESADFLYIEETFFVGPEKGGDRAYGAFASVLQRYNLLAVGRLAGPGLNELVIVRPYKGGLVMHFCYYADEDESRSETAEVIDLAEFRRRAAAKEAPKGTRRVPAARVASGESTAVVIDFLSALKGLVERDERAGGGRPTPTSQPATTDPANRKRPRQACKPAKRK